MPIRIVLGLVASTLAGVVTIRAADPPARPLPAVAEGWSVELVAEAPRILYPTAIVAAPDGALFVGSDPMDMVGPPTAPLDRVIRLVDGKATIFADKLWSVMGLEWIDGTLYVMHAPFLSAFRDNDGDGIADTRTDIATGLGPPLPGFNGINDHIAGGIRLGMDGFLYIAVGDKGIPKGVGRDGKTIQLQGGGVIRVRPDGSDLEVVSTGECNPLSVALSAADEIFTYGNDDDSKKWPNSLTHHIFGGHYGYPYQFLSAPHRALPIMAGQSPGVGAQGICYNEDGLPPEYHGNLIFCDWGLQTVFRFEIKKSGGTHALMRKTPLVSKGQVADFRPFSLAISSDARDLWLADWGHNGWLAGRVNAGRIYRLHYSGGNVPSSSPRPKSDDIAVRLKSLDHPALTVRLQSQRILTGKGQSAVTPLVERLRSPQPEVGRIHALWALDAIGGERPRSAIRAALADASPRVRLQAARSVGIRLDRDAAGQLSPLLADRDAAVRREAAIAISRVAAPAAPGSLYAALGESDLNAAWSIRQAIRRSNAWDKVEIVKALSDDRRMESALRLTDESWAVPAVEALVEAFKTAPSPAVRGRILANLASQYRRYPEWSGLWFGTNPLASPIPRKTVEWSEAGSKLIEGAFATALADPSNTVRFQAIVGLGVVGPSACSLLRTALLKERDPINLTLVVDTLGALVDPLAAPILSAILTDRSRPESVRLAVLGALSRIPDRRSVTARFSLLYDPDAPASLVARALPDLARSGLLPPNDLASFLESPAPGVRAAAVLSLNVKKALPAELEASLLDRLSDREPTVREAAMAALVPLQLRSAIPRLLAIAGDRRSPDRFAAIGALCGIPDSRALAHYLDVIAGRDPRLRAQAERAVRVIAPGVRPQLISALEAGTLSESAALAVESALAQFEPVRDWRVIGPFPRTTPSLFIGEPKIDLARAHAGAQGQSLVWATRQGEAATGRVALDDLIGKPGDIRRSGYEGTTSPDLCAFAYAEFAADQPGPALLSIGSSGTLIVTVNEQPVYHYNNAAGRGYAAGTDVVRAVLAPGKNRILVVCRQGIGPWCFGIQIAQGALGGNRPAPGSERVANLRKFALEHAGDPLRGRALFFDGRGVGCVRCHRVSGDGSADIGPDLGGLAAKYDRAEIIRSVLEPSHRIAHGYQPVIVSTRDGKVLSGVVRTETENMLELADSDARTTQVAKSDIEVRRTANVSIMPAQLAENVTPTEFADLIEYLMSLRPKPAGSR
jgi:putative heme-binding domain-containing protein